MRKPIIVIKLGGSALTDKRRIYTPRTNVIRKAARQIAFLSRKFEIVLIHGAGSYGHIPAKKWNLHAGFRHKTQLAGLSSTKSKLLEWETILEAALLKNRVPVVPLFASDFIVLANGRIHSADIRPFKNWLKLGCVPSIGGDIVTDLRKGFAILSGDQLAAYLAFALRASKLVFGTDVDGIYDSNPKINKKARLLKTISVAEATRLTHGARSSTTPDVTGGMAGKISEAIVAARNGIPVYFANLTKDSRLTSVALDRRVTCSRIVPN